MCPYHWKNTNKFIEICVQGFWFSGCGWFSFDHSPPQMIADHGWTACSEAEVIWSYYESYFWFVHIFLPKISPVEHWFIDWTFVRGSWFLPDQSHRKCRTRFASGQFSGSSTACECGRQGWTWLDPILTRRGTMLRAQRNVPNGHQDTK